MVAPFLVFRGLGKWLNPLALEARDSRFKSGVPDQFFDNSSELRAGVAHWLSAGSPVQATEFDSPHSLQPA